MSLGSLLFLSTISCQNHKYSRKTSAQTPGTQCKAGRRKQRKGREEFCRTAPPVVPYLIFLIVHQEEPVELHKQWAAVGDCHVADHLGVVQNAAEVQLHGLKAEVGEMHFATQLQAVYLRVLQVLDR